MKTKLIMTNPCNLRNLWILDVDSNVSSVRDSRMMDKSPSRRRFFLLMVSVIAAFATACSSSLFKVKPVVDLPPLPASSQSAEAGGLRFHVAPLVTDEESQELFESNLPVAGLLPLRIQIDYDSGVPVEIKPARFRLRDGQGRDWKLLPAKKACSRIMSANGISAYNPSSRKQFEKEFGAYELDLKTPLSSGEKRQGFLFFQTPDKKPVESPRGLSLIVERLPQPVEIKLN
jgi:hypothetical protein